MPQPEHTPTLTSEAPERAWLAGCLRDAWRLVDGYLSARDARSKPLPDLEQACGVLRECIQSLERGGSDD